MTPSRLLGIVLGAGDGVRMGGSKAILLLDGEPLAVAHATRMREAGCDEVVVVVRPAAADRLGSIAGARLVTSTAEDPAGSLAVALRSVEIADGAIVVITPVDAAPASPTTVERLLGALGPDAASGALAATPVHEGKGGHPIACRIEALRAYAGDPAPPLRDVLRALGARRVRVEVDDPGVLVDLDTPAEVETVTGSAPALPAPSACRPHAEAGLALT